MATTTATSFSWPVLSPFHAAAAGLALFGLGAAVGATLSLAPTRASPVSGPPYLQSPPPAPPRDSPELRLEQLSRSRQFFGEKAHKRVEAGFVVVVGVGGVGSHAAHALCRAGIGRLRLIDVDLVTLSSLNRHATATREDVGSAKVVALQRALARIAPSCAVDAVRELFTAASAERLLLGAQGRGMERRPDYVLDCIDDKESKAALIVFCRRAGLRVLSSLGAGGKADPTRVLIGDLGVVRRDPLGTAMRQLLRRMGELPKASEDGREVVRCIRAGGADKAVLRHAVAEAADEPGWDAEAAETGSGAATDAGISAAPFGARPNTRRQRKRDRQPRGPGNRTGSVAAVLVSTDAVRGGGSGDEAVAAVPAASAAAIGAGAPEIDDDPDDAPLRMTGILCVYSSETARAKLLPLAHDVAAGEQPEDFGALPGFRVRVMPVLGTVPAAFGMAMAAFVLCALAGGTHALAPIEAVPLPLSSIKKVQNSAAHYDNTTYPATQLGWSAVRGGLSLEEAEWVVGELWHQRSPLSGLRFATRGVQMGLARWRPWAGSVPSNTVLLHQAEASALLAATAAAAHAPEGGAAREAAFRAAAEAVAGAEAFERVERRLRWAREQGWA